MVAFSYRPAVTFFSQDDFWFLDRVRRADSLSRLWALVDATDCFYRPVPRVLVLKLEHLLFNLQPFAFHAFSWLIHVANSGMMFGLWRFLWRNNRLAFIAALYYGLHSVHFVPVTWVSGIQELSVTFWSLLSILAYVHGRKYAKRWSLALSLLAFGLAVFSKENGLAALIFIALVDINLRPETWFALLRNKIGYLVIVVAFLWIRALKASGPLSGGPYAWHFDLVLIWRNMRWYLSEALYVRPWAVDHPVAGSLIALGIVILVLWVYLSFRRYRQALIVGGIGFAGAIAPVLLFDRVYSYYLSLPLLGFSLLFAATVDSCWLLMRQRIELAGPAWRALGRKVAGPILIGWFVVGQLGLEYARETDPLGLNDKAHISQRTIDQVLALYPRLPDDSKLFVRGASERDFWAMGKGSLFSLFYYPSAIEVFFDVDTPLTAELLASPSLYVYDFGQD
jgi:hypothetical protein